MSEQAGRELDARVAEKVLGWRWIANAKGGFLLVPPEQHSKLLPAYVFEDKDGSLDHRKLGHYSTSIAAAWEVVEKFEAMQLFRYTTGRYIACLADGNSLHEGEADTAPLAICKAAMKAVGAEGEGEYERS